MPIVVSQPDGYTGRGSFACPACGQQMTDKDETCPHCGSTPSKAAVSEAKFTGELLTGEEEKEARSGAIYCQYCGSKTNLVRAGKNKWRCANGCGGMVEEGHEEEFIPNMPIHEEDAQPVLSAPSLSPSRQVNVQAIAIVAGVVVLLIAIIALISWMVGKSNERKPITVILQGFEWRTSMEVEQRVEREHKSGQPASGDNITPLPKATEWVRNDYEVVGTAIATYTTPQSPILVATAVEFPCPEDVATPAVLDTGAISIPACRDTDDDVYEDQPDIVVTEVMETMSPPTPVYQDVYPYIEVVWERTSHWRIRVPICPPCVQIPPLSQSGYRSDGVCHYQYWVILQMPDGQLISWPVEDADQWASLMEGGQYPAEANGWGTLVSVEFVQP